MEDYKAEHTGSQLDHAVQWSIKHLSSNPTEMQEVINALGLKMTKTATQIKISDGINTITIGAPTLTSAGLIQYSQVLSLGTCLVENSITRTASAMSLKGKNVKGTVASLSIPAATNTLAGVMSADDKKKLLFFDSFLGDDYELRTSGKEFEMNAGDSVSLGVIHLKDNERIQITSDEQSDIEVSSKDDMFRDSASVDNGTVVLQDHCTTYSEFVLSENHAQGATITVKIV